MANFFEKIEINPVIAAVNDLERLDEALDSPCENIFLLTGNIFNLKEIAYRVKSKNKGLYIQVDLIDGFSKDTWGLEYIIKNIYPHGIITTKSNLVRMSNDLGAFTIQRLFVLDSTSLKKGIESIHNIRPHAVEILPGIMPKIVKIIYEKTKIPIITGGLIMDKEDVIQSLNAGAIAVSTSNKNVWNWNT
ncbi:MAG: glycerol-3-phosphate responsive antiterminator [Tissierellia bacterium]|nr:glycerol-3-phosphate responsive antiterminator [Tissierellia bacterium]